MTSINFFKIGRPLFFFNGRPPKQNKMEDDLKINLIGCDTIVNSPSNDPQRKDRMHKQT